MSKENESGFTPEEAAELETPAEEIETGETGSEETTPADTTTATDAGKTKAAVTKPPAGYVPQESLHEARQRIKEEKARADRFEATFQKFMERQGQPEKTQAPQIRDANTDLVGNLEDRLRIAEERLQEATKTQEQRTTAEQQQGQTQELLNKYAASVRIFKRTATDFDTAYQFVADVRDKELELLGYDDPTERSQRLQYEEGMIVGRALHSGKDPAKMLYDYAVSRGYKATAQAAANDNTLERLKKGQQAAKTLSGGKSPDDGEMTLDKLSVLYDTDPDEADKMFAKMRRAGRLG